MQYDPPFGQWLRNRRRELDLTQGALAAQVSCSAEMIHKIEGGRARPSRQLAGLLAIYLGITVAERPRFVRWARGANPDDSDDEAGAFAVQPRHNLPPQFGPLFGRAPVLAQLRDMLTQLDLRLLTLTGPAGIGKTSLALQLAADLAGLFADGVFLVPLGRLDDAALVLPTIAQSLGLRKIGGQPVAAALSAYLRDREILLLLDQFERVPAAGPAIINLLLAADRLTIVVTSRTALGLPVEQEYEVPPLSVPDPEHLPKLNTLASYLRQYGAVELFVARAQAVRADFTLNNTADACAVAEITRRLEGQPRAIELAAAQSQQLSPREILQQLTLDATSAGSRQVV